MRRTAKWIIKTLLLFSVFSTIANAASDLEWKIQVQMRLPVKATILAYSSDGTRIGVGHSDGRVSIFDSKSGELVRLLNAHTKEVNSVQFIRQDSQLLTIGDDHRARIWSTSDWVEVTVIEGIAFAGGVSPDNKWLVAQDPKQAVWVWDLSTLKPIKQLSEAGKGGAQTITFAADGKSVLMNIKPLLVNVETKDSFSFVSQGDKKTAVNIETLGGNQAAISLGALQDDDAIIHRTVASKTGAFVALGRGWYGQPAFVDLWDVSTRKRLFRLKPKGSGTLTSFSFDNSLIAIEGSEKVTLWQIVKGKQVGSIQSGGIMQFSPKAMELAVTDGESLIIYIPKEK